MKKIIIAALAAAAVLTALQSCRTEEQVSVRAPGEWPEITSQTKPWTRWWWLGSAVTPQGLDSQLQAYADAGLGGVEITPIYGVRGLEDLELEFLSPEWMDALCYTLDRADSLGLGVDLANTSGWPFGGPWVTDDMASRYMTIVPYEVQGGRDTTLAVSCIERPLVSFQDLRQMDVSELSQPLNTTPGLDTLCINQVRFGGEMRLERLMATSEDGTTIDVTDRFAAGEAKLSLPEGNWSVCAIFSAIHGKNVERAGPGGAGYVIDHFSKETLDRYLARFDEAFEDRDLSHLRYFFNDSYEVDDAFGESNFTPAIFDAFAALNGYRLEEHLPELAGLRGEELSHRVGYDFRMTISALLRDEFTKGWQSWAAARGKGIRNQGHGSPANNLDLYAASDIPEIEGREFVNLKAAPSAAHVTGKNLISAETCTWLRDHFMSSLDDVKQVQDMFFLAGVNHVFFHGTSYTDDDAAWPGYLFYAAVHFTTTNTWWEHLHNLNEYIARCQSFLQMGSSQADILVYYNTADRWMALPGARLDHIAGFGVQETLATGKSLCDAGYSWDGISDIQLRDVQYKGGLHVGGHNYKAIVVPECKYMPEETLRKLAELSLKGAPVIFVGDSLPQAPGLAGLAAEDYAAVPAKFSFGPLEAALEECGVVVEPMYALGMQCIARIKDDGSRVYFVKNATDKTFDGPLPLACKYKGAVLYDPMTGASGRATVSDGGVRVQLAPGETVIVDTYSHEVQCAGFEYLVPSDMVTLLNQEWTIRFLHGGPSLPVQETRTELTPWSSWGGEEHWSFSGTAEYSTTVPALTDDEGVKAWRLSFHNLYYSAEVFVGDEFVGSTICAPYYVDIPADALHEGDTLRVQVANLMLNRVKYMDQEGRPYRIFRNANVASHTRETRGPDGLFNAAWLPAPKSGIEGPVTLTPLH